MLDYKKTEECQYREGLNAKGAETRRNKSVSELMRKHSRINSLTIVLTLCALCPLW